ncbi:MAG: SIMPL domain-containing protein [Syntrophomonadaceae bacterium]|nr:SIMPL domain-containing protein [Syntrophomonadaceae bacterium]
MFRRLKRSPALLVLATVLLAMFTLGGFSPVQDMALADSPTSGGNAPTLVVSGAGTVSVTPDQAKATVAVLSNDKLLTVAQEENSSVTRKVIDALVAAGVPGNNIETANFSVWPQYSYPGEKDRDRPPTIVGYQVRNELNITVNDVSKLGKALDAALKAGANEVVNVYYKKADTSQATNEALQKACQEAMKKAKAIAGALGMQLGPIITVHEGTNSDNLRYPIAMRSEGVGGAGDIPIQPGQLQVQANVTLTFALK